MATGLNLGMAAGTDVPVAHLDYGYIRECKDASEVEKLLQILRSGKEGIYPDLVKFTEERLSQLDPNSHLLVEEGKKKRLADLPGVEQRDLEKDIESWTQAIQEEESSLLTAGSSSQCNGERDREREREILRQMGLPPIRTAGTIPGSQPPSKNSTSTKSKASSQRIKSTDFQAWDKFDAEAAGKAVERETERGKERKENGGSERASKIFVRTELSESEKDMTEIERKKLAIHEKEKGNDSFRSGDYEEAVAYYSHSLLLSPSIAAYNNRALMFIKLERHSEAVEDCLRVLQEEPNNVKALFRLATARTGLKEDDQAMADFDRLLKLEPSNKKAQDQLRQLRVRQEAKGRAGEKLLKKNRLHIVEVEGCGRGEGEREGEGEGEGEKGEEEDRSKNIENIRRLLDLLETRRDGPDTLQHPAETTPTPAQATPTPSQAKTTPAQATPTSAQATPTPSQATPTSAQATPTPAQATPTPVQATPTVAPPPLPPAVQKLKEDGNKLFRSGQYAEASEKYSRAISRLEQESDERHSVSLATLLNNRAACSLKTGQCNSCITDCSRSISLLPLNHKAILRRAKAYEMKEKFQEAFMDYHLSLRLDSSVSLAQDAVTRLARHLQGEHGFDWRVQLPSHPDADLILDALRALQSQHDVTPLDAAQTHLADSDRTQEIVVDPQPVAGDASTSSDETPVTPQTSVDAGKTPADAVVTPADPDETAANTTETPAEVPVETTETLGEIERSTEMNETPANATESPADTNETPADTTETPADTNETPADTTETPADTTETPADTTETPADTTETPADTTETPTDTTETPTDTTETPADTTETPTDTTETPADTTERPADTNETPADTTETPADTNETPADTTESSNATRKPSDAAETSAEVTETPANTSKTPSDATETPADAIANTTETPAEVPETPANTSETQSDATETPADPNETQVDATANTPAEETETPANTPETPSNTNEMPANTTETPASTTETPPNVTETPADESPEEPDEPVNYEKMYDEYKSKGNRHVKKDEFTEAVQYYSRCIEIFPDRAAAYNNRAFCHLKMKNPDAAERDCSHALELEPDNIKALYRRGVARKERGMYREAVKDLRHLVSLDSSNAAGNKELEVVKQLWEKQLRSLQTKPNRSGTKTDHQRTKKVPSSSPSSARGPTSTRGQVNTGGQWTTKSSSSRGKTKGSAAKSRGTGKNSPPGEPAKSAAASAVGQGRGKDTAERVTPQVNTRTSAITVESLLGGSERRRGEERGRGEEGDGFITANRTTYYKKNGESKPKKRTKIEIVEIDQSSEDEDGLERESSGSSEVEREREERERRGEGGRETRKEREKEVEEGSGGKGSMKEGEEEEEKGGKAVVGETEEGENGASGLNCESREKEGEKADKTMGNPPHPPSPEPTVSSSDSPSPVRILTSYEFVQRWNAIPRSARSEDYAKLLSHIPLHQLPDIITNKLDGTMLSHILEAINDCFIPRGMYQLTSELLYNLSKVQRFSVISMFLSRSEKQTLSKVLDTLSSQDTVKISPDIMEHIRVSYGI